MRPCETSPFKHRKRLPMPTTMVRHAPNETSRRGRQLLVGVLLAGLLSLATPAITSAAVTTFDSLLSVPATRNTSDNLGYPGTNTSVPPSAEAPSGVVHTSHYGADTALWNTTVAGGSATAPATGQALKVALEGCAQPAAGGPPPLTQIHFQDLSPIPDGGAKVNISSQPFDIPVCGQNGASGSTVTTYDPINLCVRQGDYVALNEEGGFVEKYYRSGVPYQVIGSVAGSSLDSFIRGGGTGNGTTLSATDTGPMDGFASNQDEELMLQVTLGTGPDATHICSGGTGGLAPALPALKIRPQTDGVNHSQNISVAIYCRPAGGCRGAANVSLPGKSASYRHVGFNLPGNKTSHMSVHLGSALMGMLRRHHGVSALVTAVMDGTTFSQTITVKIL
jgi:hypothetical protein